MATQLNGTTLVLNALFNQYLPNAPDPVSQIIDLITLELTVDSIDAYQILGRFAGSHNNGIIIVSGKWYWPGTTPPLVTGYCYHFVKGAGGRILECNFLDCEWFLASSDLRNSDTVKYVTLQGDEFLDSIADKWNPAFPAEDDEGECGVTFRNAGWCGDDSNDITLFTFETDTWSEGEDTQPVDEDESEDESEDEGFFDFRDEEEAPTMRQGFFAFCEADLEGVPDEEGSTRLLCRQVLLLCDGYPPLLP